MDLFKDAKTSASSHNQDNDGEVSGHKRIYFYKRKTDNLIFAIENERQATHIHRQKQFSQMYHYLGYSDGKEYRRKVEALRDKIYQAIDAEIQDKKLSGDEADDYRMRRYKEIWNKNKDKVDMYIIEEAKIANQNTEHTPPRDFRIMGLNGLPQENAAIKNGLQMIQ